MPSGTAHISHLAIGASAQGETWPEIFASLRQHLPAIRRSIAIEEPLGVSLKLPAMAAFELYDPENLEALRAFLREQGLYVFSLDGVDFGSRGLPVDTHWSPHLPDWRDPRRMSYTNVLADILADLLPEEVEYGSIATVALGGREDIDTKELPAVARNLLRFAAYLAYLRQHTGRTLLLALEPGPGCVLQGPAETARCFHDHLLSPFAMAQFASAASLPHRDARAALHTHLGVCLNASHLAAMFETPPASIDTLRRAGIRIGRVRINAALCTRNAGLIRQLVTTESELAGCPIVEKHAKGLLCHTDAHTLLAQHGQLPEKREWRIACNAPASQASVGPFATTQSFTRKVLQLQGTQPLTAHLSVEPAFTLSSDASIAHLGREYAWMRDELNAGSRADRREPLPTRAR